jgi:glycosyltransferase involved in cell wall biosynthesis
MKFSIVMAYYNRKQLLLNTLYSISLSTIPKSDYEVIIVDDASSDEHKLTDIENIYGLQIKVYRIELVDKWWVNPCVPYNLGFKYSSGDYIVIQNPECLHFGDMLLYFNNYMDVNKYLSASCYSINQQMVNSISAVPKDTEYFKYIGKIINPITSHMITLNGGLGFYNHPTYRPVHFHFTSCINRIELYDLGGFDMRYANGIAYDDNEFITRIRRKCMDMIILPPSPLTLHQWHYSADSYTQLNTTAQTVDQLLYKNEQLFTEVTRNETGWKVNQKCGI